MLFVPSASVKSAVTGWDDDGGKTVDALAEDASSTSAAVIAPLLERRTGFIFDLAHDIDVIIAASVYKEKLFYISCLEIALERCGSMRAIYAASRQFLHRGSLARVIAIWGGGVRKAQ